MVGPWPLAPHHDHLQYIHHHIHIMQRVQNRGVTHRQCVTPKRGLAGRDISNLRAINFNAEASSEGYDLEIPSPLCLLFDD